MCRLSSSKKITGGSRGQAFSHSLSSTPHWAQTDWMDLDTGVIRFWILILDSSLLSAPWWWKAQASSQIPHPTQRRSLVQIRALPSGYGMRSMPHPSLTFPSFSGIKRNQLGMFTI